MVSASGGAAPPDPLLVSSPIPQHPHNKNLPTPLLGCNFFYTRGVLVGIFVKLEKIIARIQHNVLGICMK